MQLAIMSDIHDNIWQLEHVLSRIRDSDAIIFCGDFCAPFTLAQISEGFKGPVHVVWGNNDGDKMLLMKYAQSGGNVILHGDMAELELGNRRLAANHYPQIARPLAMSGTYDAVFYGHDHTPHTEQIGQTLLLNPGEVMGRFGTSTYASYDTNKGSAEIMTV